MTGRVAGLVIGLAAAATMLRAGDITTLTGTTFREVKVVRVEPDGVTWEHSTGMVKVDFTDLSEAVRKEFHYDAQKAAAFHAAQTRQREQAAARAQQVLREDAARQDQRARAQQAAAAGKPGEFVYYRQDRVIEVFERSLGEQIDAQEAAQARLKEFDGTIYDRRLWAIPCMFLGHSDGHLFDPPPPPPPDFGGGVDYRAMSWTERVIRDDSFGGQR